MRSYREALAKWHKFTAASDTGATFSFGDSPALHVVRALFEDVTMHGESETATIPLKNLLDFSWAIPTTSRALYVGAKNLKLFYQFGGCSPGVAPLSLMPGIASSFLYKRPAIYEFPFSE